MSYRGDIRLEDTIDLKFTTRKFSTGAPFALASGVISAYIDNNVTQLTAGITLSADFDGVTGLNNVRVVATAVNGYAAGTDVELVITTGTVDSVSVVGEVIGSFSIENRSALMPTTVARKLDVSAGGEAGLDWANIGSPTTAQNLSATNIDVDQIVASVSGAVASVTGAVGSVTGAVGSVTGAVGSVAGAVGSVTAAVTVGTINAAVITAASIAADAITDAKVAADVTIASVTGAVGSVTGAVGSIAAGGIAAASFAAGAIDAAAIAANAIGASELAADAVAEIADQVWDEVIAGHLGVGSTGAALNAAGTAGDPWSTAIPGAYGAGTAGKILGDNVNATISSRATQTSVDTVDDLLDTEVAAIKAKTDSLTFTVAGQVDANIQAVNDVAIQGTGAVGTDEWRKV